MSGLFKTGIFLLGIIGVVLVTAICGYFLVMNASTLPKLQKNVEIKDYSDYKYLGDQKIKHIGLSNLIFEKMEKKDNRYWLVLRYYYSNKEKIMRMEIPQRVAIMGGAIWDIEKNPIPPFSKESIINLNLGYVDRVGQTSNEKIRMSMGEFGVYIREFGDQQFDVNEIGKWLEKNNKTVSIGEMFLIALGRDGK
jgi:hypothetical protein